ncbi:semaphorin-1A-like [Chrysoperla carnea]|uniref:semaphorin-1A-like n=1 Tax=Chrysoperla carnea TaxID=189513 RepID=UPI001D08D3CF|nr:semaphorin-1A-like [Chrysoperla carnea]
MATRHNTKFDASRTNGCRSWLLKNYTVTKVEGLECREFEGRTLKPYPTLAMIYRGLIQSRISVFYFFVLVFTSQYIIRIWAWVPDIQSNYEFRYEDIRSEVFYGNHTYSDHFKLLDSTDDYILLGGRNNLYNVSTDNLVENYNQRIEWQSLEAHQEVCKIKGKGFNDCQNYIRVLARDNDFLFLCGTNSGKPQCREYTFNDTVGRYIRGTESDGVGQCPYNPEDNTTAVWYYGHLYTATVSEFTGGEALIYRKPQRTERSDFKSLNAPNFVNSFGYGDYVFFFYRETAVEYMNCGKAVYSRIGRVCKDDKGGPHQFRDRWTTFLKARLNCSIPGDYPFYFDEIQGTSDIIRHQDGEYLQEIIYGVMTTSTNAIGGSAICAYSFKDILDVFEGPFKGQDGINANWLPVPQDKVPHPRPGKCVKDSRTLTDTVVNFIKTHPLMEQTVPAYFSKPVLVHVSLNYRFTTVSIDPQVKATDGKAYDVLYVGTDDGKLIKAIYVEGRNRTVDGVVISKSQVLPVGTPVTGLKVVRAKNNIVIVSRSEVRSIKMNHCINIQSCTRCVELQDPHCVWDSLEARCVQNDQDTMILNDRYFQSVQDGDSSKCSAAKEYNNARESNVIHQKSILSGVGEQDVKKDGEPITFNVLNDNSIPTNIDEAPPVQSLVIYKAETFQIVLISASFIALIVGFIAGFMFSRRFHPVPSLVDTSVTEQHNHLNRFTSPHLNSTNRSSFLHPRANKATNLACNIPPNKNLIKKDNNLDASKELNNSIESIDKNTLQKVKKTYI